MLGLFPPERFYSLKHLTISKEKKKKYTETQAHQAILKCFLPPVYTSS